MSYLQETYNTKRMIEERVLISQCQIQELYDFDKDQVEDFLNESDFQNPIQFAGVKYWLREHIELLAVTKGYTNSKYG